MVYRALARAGSVEVGDYRCGGLDSRRDEIASAAELAFVRAGIFQVETERGRAAVDPSRVLRLEAGERYRVTHFGPCRRDRCLVLAFEPETLREVEGGHRSGRNGCATPLALPCDDALFARVERFRAALARSGGDPLLAAEAALGLAAALLGSHARGEGSGARAAGGAADDRRVLAARALLVERHAERLTLADLGAAVGLSPYRLARLFRAATGSSLHQFRLGLRLRAALDRLVDGERDLAALAYDLGFADHAHFTHSFRRRFGVAPSEFRRSLAARDG